MKKLILVCTMMLCAGQLYGMERERVRRAEPVRNPNGDGSYRSGDRGIPLLESLDLNQQWNKQVPSNVRFSILSILATTPYLDLIIRKIKSDTDKDLEDMISGKKENDKGILILVNTLAKKFPNGTLDGDLAEFEKNGRFDKENLIRLGIARQLSPYAAETVSNWIGFAGISKGRISMQMDKTPEKNIWEDL
jgi:hypothetical protein